MYENGFDSFDENEIEYEIIDVTPTSTQIVPSLNLDSGWQGALAEKPTYVDIVICMDITQSMSDCIDQVKEMALSFYDDLETSLRDKQRKIQKLRVKVIGFRDYYCDGSQAYQESQFFSLPEQKRELSEYVASMRAAGGGDEPENGLEALAMAMKSEWTKVDWSKASARHIIVLFTDASAHPLEKSADGVSEYYPKDMLRNFDELDAVWNGQGSMDNRINQYVMDKRAQRLVLFAPDMYPWNEITEDFIQVWGTTIKAGVGTTGLGKSVIVDNVAGSIKN